MRRMVLLLSALSLLGAGSFFAQQKDAKPKDAQSAEPAPPPVPAADAQKKNPVKPTPDGLAEAKKLYGYHCAMCHGNAGSISKFTDGELFYIITNGRGKMVGGEGDRTKEEVRWNLVNLVRSFGKKSDEPARP